VSNAPALVRRIGEGASETLTQDDEDSTMTIATTTYTSSLGARREVDGAVVSRRARICATVLGGIAVLFLLLDGAMKLAVSAPVSESMQQLGWPVSLAATIGVIELACLALYVLPRTSVLGALLLTGYLGGAVATHLRIGSPLPTHTLFPIYVALLLWGALWLRDARLRALVPFRR
jgi:hypothetical protein